MSLERFRLKSLYDEQHELVSNEKLKEKIVELKKPTKLKGKVEAKPTKKHGK